MTSLDKSGESAPEDEEAVVSFPIASPALQNLITSGKYRVQFDLLAEGYYTPANVEVLSKLCETPVVIQAQAEEPPRWLLELDGQCHVLVRDGRLDYIASASEALEKIRRKRVRQLDGLYTVDESISLISHSTGADATQVRQLITAAIKSARLIARSQGGGCPITMPVVPDTEAFAIDHAHDDHGLWVLDISELRDWVTERFRGQQIRHVQFPQVGPTAALTQPSQTEAPSARQDRRLKRLRELGCDFIRHGEGWRTDGKKGALAQLEREERTSGQPMKDKTNIRDDLIAAVLRKQGE